MPDIKTLRLKPVLGLKNDVPADDASLIQWITKDMGMSHDTNGQNIDYQINESSVTKCYGYTALTSAACSGPARCNAIFELDDGVNDDILHFESGIVRDITDGTASDITSSVTFANTDGDLYSVIKFGSHAIWADGTNVPYKWKNGDTEVSHLINVGGGPTEYTFKYLAEWQQRIIGANSTESNGDLEIRWTSALPDFTSDIAFAAANQLYKPTVDSITGLSKLGTNILLIYGEESITQLVYYPTGDTPFGMFTLIDGEGCTGHHSIVNAQGSAWFFNKNHGFVRYAGGASIAKRDIISYDIKSDIIGIDERYYDRIIGAYVPFTEEICWAVPLGAQANPTHLLFYHIPSGKWRKEVKPARAVGVVKTSAGSYGKLVHGNTDGHVYHQSGNDFGGNDIDGYRIEPILDFGDPLSFKFVKEVWFGIVSGGNYSVDLSHRSGDTTKEVLAQSWTSMGSLSLNNPSEPTIRINQSARLHQFKWGTDKKDEPFSINWLDIKYRPEPRY